MAPGATGCHAPHELTRAWERTVRLEHLCRIRFTYPEEWRVGLEGGWEQHLFLAEGRCEGSIAGSVLHLSDSDPYRRLNDVICVCVGEVRAPEDLDVESPDLMLDVAELIWEPIAV
jgi:hypothetical protein